MKHSLSRSVGAWLAIEHAEKQFVRVVYGRVTTKNSITPDTIVQEVWITFQLVSLLVVQIG